MAKVRAGTRLAVAVLVVTAALGLVPLASAQTSCSTVSQATLLTRFADTVAAGSITPAYLRDFVCSVQQLLQPGLAAVPQTVIASPFSFLASTPGALVVSSGQVQISRNNGSTFYTAGLSGGTVPVLAGDQVTVTWFSSVIPTVTFLPAGT